MLGCHGDFMILSAILDYELSLVYDIWAWVLKLLWCLYEPKGIHGYYLSHQIMMHRWPEGNLRILFVPLNFVNVGMPRWFYDLECNFRLWIVTHIWYMSLSFEIIMISLWPEMNWWILFVPLNYDASMTRKELTDIICPIKICKCWMPRWFYDLECNSRLWIVTHIW